VGVPPRRRAHQVVPAILGGEQGRPQQEVGVEEEPIHDSIEVDALDLVRTDLVAGSPVVVQVAVEILARSTSQ